MANLSIRKLDDKVVEKLRNRASQHGVSMEEEVRRIIEEAVSNPARLGDMALQYFGKEYGEELQNLVHKPHQPVQL